MSEEEFTFEDYIELAVKKIKEEYTDTKDMYCRLLGDLLLYMYDNLNTKKFIDVTELATKAVLSVAYKDVEKIKENK